MSYEKDIASFSSVSYNPETDDVFITFRVNDIKYKDFVLRWAANDHGRLVLRGEKLAIIEGDANADV